MYIIRADNTKAAGIGKWRIYTIITLSLLRISF